MLNMGLELLTESGLAIIPAQSFDEAANTSILKKILP
jgi:hypothetical protein